MNSNNDAAKYNEVKDICLSHFNKDHDLEKALSYIESQRTYLGKLSTAGLKGELVFYSLFMKEYSLTPANDYGINADFVGLINGKLYRIDVTTNAQYKDPFKYEGVMQLSNINYKIAEMDIYQRKMKQLIDVQSAIQAKAMNAINGPVIDIAIFMDADEGKYNYYQQIISVNVNDPYSYCNPEVVTSFYLPDIGTIASELNEEYGEEDECCGTSKVHDELEKYLITAAGILSKETNRKILACGFVHKPIDEDEDCTIRLEWMDPNLKRVLDPELFIDLSDDELELINDEDQD